jgi:deoxyribodipyrimidine photolyase-related protein
LYWDFLMRHEELLSSNQRMALQVRNVAKMTAGEREGVMRRATAIRLGEVGAGN